MAFTKIGQKPTICFVPEFEIRQTNSGEFVAVLPATPIDEGLWEIQVLGTGVLNPFVIPGHRIEAIPFPGKLSENGGIGVCRIAHNLTGDGFMAVFIVEDDDYPAVFNAEPTGAYGWSVELPIRVSPISGCVK